MSLWGGAGNEPGATGVSAQPASEAIEPSRCADACVLINVCTSPHFASILSAQASPLLVVRQVVDEALFIEKLDGERQQIDVNCLAGEGLVEVVDLDDEGLALFIDYAASIDDGEAASIAACVREGWHLVTDDRGAIRFVSDRDLRVPILRTSDLIQEWVTSANPLPPMVSETLRAIQERARFLPPRSDPNYDWWMRSL
jgi:hypothetical protein